MSPRSLKGNQPPVGRASTISDLDVEDIVRNFGIRELARRQGISERNAAALRERVERRLGRTIVSGGRGGNHTRPQVEHAAVITRKIKDGVVLVGSDAHYWPGPPSTAHRAFVHMCKKLDPVMVVKNGDAFDGASISRHTPIGWEERPRLIEEIETCKARLEEISTSAPNADCLWPLGNHDARFETRLATVAPEYAKVHGVHLKDHFPDWSACWRIDINDDVVIKHRWKGGIHATHNNTVNSGKTMVTGHLHSLKVTPYSDYNGTRFGVDCGTMADPYGPQFANYTEMSPVNWRSGFAVLTFRDGRLMWPELVHVFAEDRVEFRGEVIRV